MQFQLYSYWKEQMHNDRGAILITMLILMVIVTIIGVIAINSSTVDIQISGNVRRATSALEGAEAGADLSVSVIENTIVNAALTPSAIVGDITTLDTTSLFTEIMSANDYDTSYDSMYDSGSSSPSTNPDVAMADLGGVAVNTDIDRLYAYAIAGGALEFASGYEGVGAGAAGGGTGVLYMIDSEGTE